jgi:hypothetical protein
VLGYVWGATNAWLVSYNSQYFRLKNNNFYMSVFEIYVYVMCRNDTESGDAWDYSCFKLYSCDNATSFPSNPKINLYDMN